MAASPLVMDVITSMMTRRSSAEGRPEPVWWS